MKTAHKLIISILSTYMVMGTGYAIADTSSLETTAEIIGICKFASGPYGIPFGTLDPTSTTNAVLSSVMSYRCTHGTKASSINIGTGTGSPSPTTVAIKNGTYSLPVTLDWLTPTTIGTGFGPSVLPIEFTVTGTIFAVDLHTAVAGTYVGIFPVTLLP